MCDSEDQDDEILAVSEILDQGTFKFQKKESGGYTGTIEVHVDLTSPVAVLETEDSRFSVKYLPPILLEFTLPQDYPSQSSPLAKISCVWLTSSQREVLKKKLDELAQECLGTVVLFMWINLLQQETFEILDISNELDLKILKADKIKSGAESRTRNRNDLTSSANASKSKYESQRASCSGQGSSSSSSINPSVSLTACSQNFESQSSSKEGSILCSNFNSMAIKQKTSAEESRLNPNASEFEIDKHKKSSSKVNSKSSPGVKKRSPDSRENKKKNRKSGKEKERKTSGEEDRTEERYVGKVRSWNLNQGKGSIHCYKLGEVEASMFDIIKPDFSRLEVSLCVGTQVQFQVETIKGSKRPRAVNITGPDQKVVEGNRSSEQVVILEENLIGHMESWNNRIGDGSLLVDGRDSKESVYVYYTSLHFDNKLVRDSRLKFIFNLVECKKYGRLAQYVRIHNEATTSDMTLPCSSRKLSQSSSVKTAHQESKDLSEENISVIKESSNSTWNSREAASSDRADECDMKQLQKSPATTLLEGHNEKTEKDNEMHHTSNIDSTEAVTVDKSEDVNKEKVHAEAEDESKVDQKEDPMIKRLATRLKEFNTMKEEKMFGVTLFSCLVCFCEKIGSNCIKFPLCSHVYCKECMSQYFTVQIESGQVKNLTCPSDECKSQALPSQVEELVNSKLYAKYEHLLLDTTLQSMADVITCPRIYCQCPTVIDREHNLGQCPACFFSFCIYCLATYHGVSPCKIKAKEQRELCNKYTEGTDEDRAFMEKRYGKAKLQQLMDNVKSEDYLTKNAVTCPHCNAPIEKNDGCNKMTCWRCHTNFCWLCGEKLSAQNPYSHFNIMGNTCYGALFAGLDPEMDEEWELDFFL